jgi:cell division protease FtsH
VLFQSDLEHLIGKRPFEEKKPADVVHDHHHHDENPSSNGSEGGGISAGVPPAEIIPKP